ncbi:MAG: SUMF1/EgtB/PvdO family nonheme iron enzyme [Nitrospira sp.]|nr:SUMF1/EgtB/PvdO family nonheme iron enzyme [Nitrospira sp.]
MRPQRLTDRPPWIMIAAVVMTVCAGALEHVVAAHPLSNEPDPVPMVTIPAGSFLMGNPDGKGRVDESPQRTVYLDEYSIDQVEVTNERYLVFVKSTGHRNPPNPYSPGLLTSIEELSNYPWCRRPGTTPKLIAVGQGSACPLRPNGKKRRAGQTAAYTPGAMSLRPWNERTLIVVGG